MEDLIPYANSEYQKEVAELKKKGLNNREIMAETDRSYESVKAALRTMRHRKKNGITSETVIHGYRKLTDEDLVSIIELRSQGMTYRDIAETFGFGKTAIERFLTKQTHLHFWENYNPDKPVAYGEISSPETKRRKIDGKKFVFTSAQNNTHIHRNFLKSLETYCKHNDAQLIVSTFAYNIHGFQNLTKDDEGLWYDPAIKKYIIDEPLELCDDLYFCGELNILPTAVNPLSGFNNYTGMASAIIPHVKVQLESVPTPKHDPAKLLYTTGTVTQRNYIQKKAGQIAEWHHVYGACVVEIDDEGDWFVRQLIADSDTGCFYDLNTLYKPSDIEENHHALAINYGDVHVAKLDEEVAEVSWRNSTDSMMATLKPEYQFVHDVYDQQARNHHNVNDPHHNFQLFKGGKDSVEDELLDTAAELLMMAKRTHRDSDRVVIVDSNHDRALERWLKEGDYKKDPTNAVIFLELQAAKYKSIDEGNSNFHLFEHAMHKFINMLEMPEHIERMKFLREDESFRLNGIEFGMHGHLGNNGGRGSIRAFNIQGIKANTGHSHCMTRDHLVNVKGQGWKYISEVKIGDFVTGMKNGQVVYTEVTDTISNLYTGHLFKINGYHFKQTVTDQHNLFLTDGSYINVKDAILTRQASEVPICGLPADEIEEYPISDEDIKKLVAFTSDGHLSRLRSGNYAMRFHFKKQRKIDRAIELFGDDLTPFSEQRSGSFKCSIKSGSESHKFLMSVFKQQTSKKHLPKFLMNLNNRQADLFLSELKYWDGTFKEESDTGVSHQFSTVKSDEVDIISTLTHRLGYRTSCWRKGDDPKKGMWLVTWFDGDPSSKDIKEMSYTKRKIESWHTVVKHVKNEPIYCLTTETSNFWVRHETSGKISLTGNSVGIKNGVYVAGVSGKLEMGYNLGGSSWSQSHIVTYPNGKRTIITLKKSKSGKAKWRA